MNVIGRFFAEEWQLALNNQDWLYTPAPSADMSLDELTAIQTTLQNLVSYWENQIVSNTADEAISNATAIRDLEQSKLNVVNSIIQLKTAGTSGSGSDTAMNPGDPVYTGSETGGSGTTWLIIIGIGAAAWYLFGKKGRKNQVATRKKIKR